MINKAILNARSKRKAKVIYDDHYLEVIRKMRVAIEVHNQDVRIALAEATTSGITCVQINDLHEEVKKRYESL